MRFNLRDLFWLILVAALAFGWFMDHKRQRRQAAWDVIDAEAKLHQAWNESDDNLDRIIQNLASENRRLRSQIPSSEE